MELNLPTPFLKRIKDQLGSETEEFIHALETPSPVSVRINPLKFSKQPNDDKVPWSKYGFYLKERPVFTLDPLFHAGAYYVQEAGSMLLEKAFERVQEETTIETVLDLCAAPGGKSTHILSLVNENCLVVSNEIINTRVPALQENLSRWGHSNSVVTSLDPRVFKSLEGYFDVIVIDAPCSGEGLFRKDPNAIKEWSESNATTCVLRQERILNEVLDCIKPGGFLIYSTCTYNPDENINQLKKLTANSNFKSIPLNIKDEWSIEELESDNTLGYQVYPHKARSEGFFIGLLQKENQPIKTKTKSRTLSVFKSKHFELSTLLKEANDFFMFEPYPNEIHFLRSIHKSKVEQLIGNISIKAAGRKLGEVKAKDFIPAHELALSNDINIDLPFIELDKENALQYLRRNDFKYDTDKTGWFLVKYEGLHIGWVKLVSGRANNKLPINYRIRNL